MKNNIKRLVFIIGLFLMFLTDVNAKELTAEEVPNNSYVIGTHIFTGNTTLFTKHIMLASKTIKSNSLDDMIVYYKTPRGKWINGADGSQLEVPSKFNIDYIDLELILTEYNITYDLDGGVASNPVIYTALTDDFMLVNPLKEGHLFFGWTGNNGDTPELEVTIEKGTTGDLEFTANWGLYGDVNNDGIISNGIDCTLITSYLSGKQKLTDNQKLVADVNNDGIINYIDVDIIDNFVGGKITVLPYDSGEQYTIDYNLDDGSFGWYAYEKYADISLPYDLEMPNKEGYVFLGWTGSNGDIPQEFVTIEKGTTGNLEYTANWCLYGDVDNDGIINGGDVTLVMRYISGKQEFTNNQIMVADVNGDYVVDYIDVDIIRNFTAGNITKLPYDSGKQYTITYNLNDGVFEDYAYKKYADVSLPYKLEVPTKDGYVFLGWTGSNGNVPQLDVAIEKGTTGNLEYTAHWIAKDEIPVAPIIEKTGTAYKDDARIGIAINFDEYELSNNLAGAEIYTKTKDGYTKIKEIDIGDPFQDVLNPGETKVYVARYYIMYNDVLKVYSNYSNELLIKNENIITYDLNGGVNDDNNPMGYAMNQAYDSLLEAPTKAGYTFIGWTGSNGDTPELEVSLAEVTTGHLHYIANWELSDESAVDITIPTAPIIDENMHINIKDGRKDVVINVCNNGVYDYDNKPYGAALYLKTKTTNGVYSYTLVDEINNNCELGAIVNPGESNVYVAATYVLDENNNRVYSNYSNELLIVNKNVVTYDLNGGINSKNNPFGYSIDYPYGYTLEAPTKDGYTFVGWTGSNGDTPELEVTIEKGTEGHLHYIANWELSK